MFQEALSSGPKNNMKRHFLILSLIAAALGMALGESAWAIALQTPRFAWPELGQGEFWLAGMGLGLAWAWSQALGWRLGFYWEVLAGLRIRSFSLLPALLGLGWRHAVKFKLPPPHD